jgi:hypothetical protein
MGTWLLIAVALGGVMLYQSGKTAGRHEVRPDQRKSDRS